MISDLNYLTKIKELDEKYSDRVQLPAKQIVGGWFVANTWQHFPSSHCHTYYFAGLRGFLTVTSTSLYRSDRNET